MSANNLVQNSDFSNEFAFWERSGQVFNSEIVNEWIDKSIVFSSAQFQTIRLCFDIFSAADIANVNLFAM